MQSYFSVGEPRDLLEGARTYYPTPVFHPKRVSPPFFDLVYMCHGEWDVLLEGAEYCLDYQKIFKSLRQSNVLVCYILQKMKFFKFYI